MSNMNITKSKFMEYIRCNRFPALNNIHKRRDLDDALTDRYYDLLDSLENASDYVYEEDFLEPDLTHLEVMMPYFTKVEVLAAKKVMSLFGGETKYGTEYGTQKLFLREFNNFNLMCYVDIFNKSGNDVNITTMFDLHRISLQYGVPITLEFDPNIISIDLEVRR